MVKSVLATVLTAMAVLTVVSCSSNKEREFGATITGASEVPPVPTTSEAVATFKLDPDGTRMYFDLQITYPIDSVNAAHIQLAKPGVNGPVTVTLWAGLHGKGFTGFLATGTLTGADLMGPMSGQTIAALADSMARGVTYVNIHTIEFPGGHIRGQIYEKQ